MVDSIEIKIDRLAYGGDGLGRLADGRLAFVPFTIPGELVRVKIVEDKPKHVRGELVEVVNAAPERIDHRCVHFMTCGGCHYQHMTYSTQLAAKATILEEQLARIGGFHSIPDIEIIGMDSPRNYRNSIQFHLTRDGKLGFQKAHSNQTFAIRECHLPEQAISRLWPQIEVDPAAQVERINVRVGIQEELLLILESGRDEAVDFSVEDLPVSVVQLAGGEERILAGSNYISMEAAGKVFTVSAGSFFQVNTIQAQSIVEYLLEQIKLEKDMTVVDAYCGVGLLSAFIAPKVKRLVGIEVSAKACEDYTTNLDEFENVELYEDAVENVLPRLNFQPDVIVADPPRSGIGSEAINGIIAQGATSLAYISCDPATMARDGKQLAARGYRLAGITLVDMFPQTYHIESISLWEK